MLNIKDFYIVYGEDGAEDEINYYSESSNSNYIISQSGKDYSLTVIDDSFKPKTYACSSISTAIQSIEILENGGEI